MPEDELSGKSAVDEEAPEHSLQRRQLLTEVLAQNGVVRADGASPEYDKLFAYLLEYRDSDGTLSRFQHLHVSWSQEAENMTGEQKAATLNSTFHEVDSAEMVEVSNDSMISIYEAFLRLHSLVSMTTSDLLTLPESERKLRMKIGSEIAIPSALASQAVPAQMRRALRHMVLSNHGQEAGKHLC